MVNKSKFRKVMPIVFYFMVWIFAVVVFWGFLSGSDAMGYSLVFLWFLLPVTTFAASMFIGKSDNWGKWKWSFSLLFGVMYMFAEYVTFSMANMLAFHKINIPDFSMLFVGIVISIAGMGIGFYINYLKLNKKSSF